MSSEYITWQNLLNEGIRRLEAGQIEESEADAREMMLCLLGWDFGTWLWNRDQTPDEATTTKYLEWVDQRLQGVPVQYVTGIQCFMGLDFKVSPAVLIPRMDTEVLVETVLGYEKEQAKKKALEKTSENELTKEQERVSARNSKNALVNVFDQVDQIRGLDLCTGSGCIAVSLASFNEKICMTACDISEEALAIAKANSEKLLDRDHQVTFVQGDLLEPFLMDSSDLQNGKLKIEKLKHEMSEHEKLNHEKLNHEKFDFIVSNPPYIAKAEILTLDPKVKDHEPMLALDGGDDGLDFYRRIAQDAPKALKEGGRLYLEIGEDQGESVPAVLKDAGWKNILVLQDLAGLDRVVVAKLD